MQKPNDFTSGLRSNVGSFHSRFRLAPAAFVLRCPLMLPSGFTFGICTDKPHLLSCKPMALWHADSLLFIVYRLQATCMAEQRLNYSISLTTWKTAGSSTCMVAALLTRLQHRPHHIEDSMFQHMHCSSTVESTTAQAIPHTRQHVPAHAWQQQSTARAIQLRRQNAQIHAW